MKKRKKRNRYKGQILFLLVVICFLSLGLVEILQSFGENREEKVYSDFYGVYEEIYTFARKNDISVDEYPDELIELLENNPETKEFVLYYPLKKNLDIEINMDEYSDCEEVPLFMQWDERWGYSNYGDSVMGLTGCGPTCLSMVSVYLLNDTKYHPRYVADFAKEKGYCVPGNGSAWTLISEGGRELGMNVVELSLDEQKVAQNLSDGNPIICIMGPGDFTSTGHFIVLTDYVDGQVKVNDPNSKANSDKLWNFEDIQYQIRNLWVCSR